MKILKYSFVRIFFQILINFCIFRIYKEGPV
jgi:hypothetical protein